MRRTSPIVTFLAAFTVWYVPGPAPAGHAAEATLAAARPAVNAIDYPTLQSAIDALPATGGIVKIPAGTFEISEPLVIGKQDVLFQGTGAATHLKNVNTDGKPALVVQHPEGPRVKKNERLWRVMLSNFRITGNEKSGHGIEAVLIEEVFIQGVTVSYHGGDGIRLDHCYEDPRVSNCLITYNKGTGLNLLGCHDIVVSANQFEENQDALHCIDGFNLCMTGNCVDDHLGDGVVIENTYGSVVSGNMIEECKGWAIVLDRDCYGNTVSANVIAHNGMGVDLRDAHGCAVSANTFTLMGAQAVHIGPNSGRITVTGNNFCDSHVGDGSLRRREGDRSAGGIVLEATTSVTITGNVFAGLSTKAIALKGQPSRRIIVANNVFTEVESEHKKAADSKVVNNLDAETNE